MKLKIIIIPKTAHPTTIPTTAELGKLKFCEAVNGAKGFGKVFNWLEVCIEVVEFKACDDVTLLVVVNVVVVNVVVEFFNWLVVLVEIDVEGEVDVWNVVDIVEVLNVVVAVVWADKSVQNEINSINIDTILEFFI